MQYLEREDCFLCAAGKKADHAAEAAPGKEKGMVTTMDYYRCEGCGGCPLREQCTTSRDPAFCKEVKVCREFAQFRDQALRQLSTPRGTLLRMNRSIQVEGGLWRTEKQSAGSNGSSAGQDQYLTGTVPALPGLWT